MASNILVSDALWRVSDQLVDTNPQFGRWVQRTLVNALNDGQRVLAKYLPSSCSRLDVIKLVPGTRQSIELIPAARILPGDGSDPVDMRGNRLIAVPVRNMGTNGTTPGRAIRPVDRAVMDVSDPSWHTKTGKFVTGAIADPRLPKVFYVTPGVPADVAVWIELPWLPDPLEVPEDGDYTLGSSDTTKLSIDDRNVDDLLNYILARAYLRESEDAAMLALAQTHTQLFVSSINTQAVAAGLPNPKLKGLPMTPEGA